MSWPNSSFHYAGRKITAPAWPVAGRGEKKCSLQLDVSPGPIAPANRNLRPPRENRNTTGTRFGTANPVAARLRRRVTTYPTAIVHLIGVSLCTHRLPSSLESKTIPRGLAETLPGFPAGLWNCLRLQTRRKAMGTQRHSD